ncbi:hypothetical protein C463_02661 [Halorubrum californiense DSM 19288]|uniref:Uncharacterized protein n=1 Tax=Halorubrum californiense DSM 19288 TaxID=1227465 RepID=M0EI42_9EURY|nr:hypothetical protein C463_02661 [Halorubrum californiense DSM 19288]
MDVVIELTDEALGNRISGKFSRKDVFDLEFSRDDVARTGQDLFARFGFNRLAVVIEEVLRIPPRRALVEIRVAELPFEPIVIRVSLRDRIESFDDGLGIDRRCRVNVVSESNESSSTRVRTS